MNDSGEYSCKVTRGEEKVEAFVDIHKANRQTCIQDRTDKTNTHTDQTDTQTRQTHRHTRQEEHTDKTNTQIDRHTNKTVILLDTNKTKQTDRQDRYTDKANTQTRQDRHNQDRQPISVFLLLT